MQPGLACPVSSVHEPAPASPALPPRTPAAAEARPPPEGSRDQLLPAQPELGKISTACPDPSEHESATPPPRPLVAAAALALCERRRARPLPVTDNPAPASPAAATVCPQATATARLGASEQAATSEPSPPAGATPVDGPAASTARLLPDTLGSMVAAACQAFHAASSWESFIEAWRPPADLSPMVRDLPHPAAQLLHTLRCRGAPVVLRTAPWTPARLDAALRRGPHKSAMEHREFLREEFADMLRKGHWLLLPASAVRSLPELRLSPLGVVPQRDRRPRTICDYSFSGVNDETAAVAPLDAMQFGRALPRLLRAILEANPRFGPVHLAKLDLADGFYRLQLRPADIPKLGVLFPRCDGEEQLVGFPLALPMGWVLSPPFFCAATETITDLANARPYQRDAPPHRLEQLAATPPPPAQDAAPAASPPRPTATDLPAGDPASAYRRVAQRPLIQHEIYVDDFVSLAQGTAAERRQIQRHLFHVLDHVFRPCDAGDPPARQEPVSVKKLLRGDACWTTRKQVLGWIIDSVAGTVELPPHRQARLFEILDSVPPSRRRISVRHWHKLLGELRSMALAIPGSRGLFSTLQEALRHPAPGARLKLSADAHDFLADFRWLADQLQARPTRIAELIPQRPAVRGATDASGTGMGGVAFLPALDGDGWVSLLWRAPFPAPVTRALVSAANPTGTISISDMELAATVAHHDVVAHLADVRELTISSVHDNIPAISWQRRGSTTTTGAAAYLLRLQALHQRFHRYVPAEVRAGVVSTRARAADRHWQAWTRYCATLGLDPDLSTLADPFPVLGVFAHRVRHGALAPSGRPVRSRTVDDTLCAVGQTLSLLGARDPRTDARGQLDRRLKLQLRSWAKLDDPPARVKPVPVSVIGHLLDVAYCPAGSSASRAVADMTALGFFFLLRPGEYTGDQPAQHPFRLSDVQLLHRGRALPLLSAPAAELLAATDVALTFSTQKNGVRGEVVALGRTTHPRCCPVRALARRVIHLRDHTSDLSTPIAMYHDGTGLRPVRAPDITEALRLAVQALGPTIGLRPADVSARSLRAGGATALLNGDVNENIIRLLGRWHSDAALRYLHLQAHTRMHAYSQTMLTAGNYSVSPALPAPPRSD